MNRRWLAGTAAGVLGSSLLAPMVWLLGSRVWAKDGAPTLQSVTDVYQALMNDYYIPLNPTTLIQGAIDGMIASLHDPYTEYFTPSQYQMFQSEVNGQFAGIGVVVAEQDGRVMVQSVIPSTPAARAGLRAGDAILSVDGRSLANMGLEEAASLIRGKPGTQVTLVIQRGTRKLTVTLTRAEITVPPVTWRMLPGGVGYIQYTMVSDNSPQYMSRALADLSKQHPRGYILDLRENPGGVVGAVVQVAQDFIPRGTIVTFVGRGSQVQRFSSRSGQSVGAPVVVLVDRGTASAAEILTAALMDHGVARVVGTTTFGKGVAQGIVQLPSGGVLKLTVARWLTPDGQSIEHVGIRPQYYAAGPEAPVVLAERLLGVRAPFTARFTVNQPGGQVNGLAVPAVQAPASTVIHGHLYVSAQALQDLLGVVPTWDAGSSTEVLRFSQSTLTLPEGGPTAMLNNKTAVSLAAPLLVRGDTQWIPLRSVAKALGFRVTQSGSTVTVTR